VELTQKFEVAVLAGHCQALVRMHPLHVFWCLSFSVSLFSLGCVFEGRAQAMPEVTGLSSLSLPSFLKQRYNGARTSAFCDFLISNRPYVFRGGFHILLVGKVLTKLESNTGRARWRNRENEQRKKTEFNVSRLFVSFFGRLSSPKERFLR
jgi:hypothetical protein